MRMRPSVVGGVVLTLAAGVGSAQPGPRAGRRGPGPMAAEMRFLELTEEQRAELESVLDAQRPQMEALHESMRANRVQLREALDSPSPDPRTVGEMVIEGARLEKEGRALRENAERALEGVLTPEQKRRREMLEAARALGPMRRPGGPGAFPPSEGPGPEPPR